MKTVMIVCLSLFLITSCSINKVGEPSFKEGKSYNPIREIRHIKGTVNVRRKSTKNSSVMFKLYDGYEVEIGDTKNGYTEILSDGSHLGYVHHKLLSSPKEDIIQKGIRGYIKQDVKKVFYPELNPKKEPIRNGFFSDTDICKAGISTIFGRPINIMRSNRRNGLIYISYTRGDGTVWKNKCKVNGRIIVWGSENGRWRNGPFDDKVSFTVNGNRIKVTEGSSSSTFNKNEF